MFSSFTDHYSYYDYDYYDYDVDYDDDYHFLFVIYHGNIKYIHHFFMAT